MFERFTEGARKVVVFGQEEARVLKHDYLGTEHLLLGLLRVEEGLASRVLGALGVASDDVRAQVARIVGVGDEAKSGEMPFTPRAKKVLDLSLREALALGHNNIGTEHVLLGLARENEGVAARILLDFGVDAETIRDEVIRSLASAPSEAAVAVALSDRPARRARRVPLRAAASSPAGRDWLPAAASALWTLVGLAVGVLLGWAIWG